MARSEAAHLVELRVLDGPNLYFTRPAVKLTIAVEPWLGGPEDRVASAADRVGLARHPTKGSRTKSGAGSPGTEHRRRFVSRLAAHLTRALAGATGTTLAVRSRPGPEPDQIVVAFPWRRRGSAEALGEEVAGLLASSLDARRSYPRSLAAAADRVQAADPGPGPTVPEPSIPVIAVTGTNGKTTTVRFLAHIARTAGRTVAYSSTDGVYLNDRLVEEGDYSGFGGAARAMDQPVVEMVVLETARGGILLRGIGALHNDVAVVTNVSADHLGLHGIHTLDQLAEVKATITRITRPAGWDVLNADDPRVLGMRRSASGRPWLFSLDSDHPALRSAVEDGGRATTVIDGWMTVIEPGMGSQPLVRMVDIPLTLAGISSHNTQNAMAVASAALGAGLPWRAVVRGLKSFVLDPESNPGRTNLFELDGRVIVIDYAHNEAGLRGLVETCHGLRSPRGEIWITFGSAGDRTNEIIQGLGSIAARGADHVAIAELRQYLRGRDADDLVARLRAGALEGGASDAPVFIDEMHALKWMLGASRPGDVVAITALSQREEIFGAMRERGSVPLGPARVRRLVRAASKGR